MPGWYVHMESARQSAQRLRDGNVPAGFPIGPAEAQDIGEICHTWRNYLAVGSLGPDMFYLLPDFKNELGVVIRNVVKWSVEVWDVIDQEFVSKWETWIGPISTNSQQLSSQLTGGLSSQLGQILDELAGAVISAFEGLLAQMGDWFGLLTSGVPQGYGEDAFYWSDIFHYRSTYQFPYELYRQARAARDQAATDEDRDDAEARMAFAVGWMSHCATDVVGHPFTNAKCGGPYRDHWQRHHLIENHMDSQCYSANHGGTHYGEYGVSALHFWAAFRGGGGREDSPAFDYFAGLPAYNTSDTPTGAAIRRVFFDLDSGPLPDHLIDGLLDAMAAVHPNGPKILAQDPGFSATDGAGNPDGRPNRAAMDEMWTIVYGFLKMSGSDGLSPSRPQPPGVFTDHSFPTPPGGDYGVDDDPARGADVDDDSFTLLDLILALFAWVVYIWQVVEWLVTVLPGLILDVLTFPAREVIYWAVVVPLWNLYLLGRRALVMAGFIVPGPDEIDFGLTVLGTGSGTFNIGALLDDPTATTLTSAFATEPSGRASSVSEFGLDSLYPRNIVRDRPADIAAVDLAGILGLTGRLQYAGDGARELKPSEWIAPWKYPLTNQAGVTVPQEGAPVHVGPYVVGDDATTLVPGGAGDTSARNALEDCKTPEATHEALRVLLPQDRHLGGPVDYGAYLVGRMAAAERVGTDEFPVPDFNLDSDRGYAWRCWDWDRHNGGPPVPPDGLRLWQCVPEIDINRAVANPPGVFTYRQPCTPPQFFHADTDNPRRFDGAGNPLDSQWYDPTHDLRVHYLDRDVENEPDPDGDDPCDVAEDREERPRIERIERMPGRRWDIDLSHARRPTPWDPPPVEVPR